MQKLLSLFISSSLHTEVFILVSFIFFSNRSCYLRPFHLPPIQKLLFLFISQLFPEIVLFVQFTSPMQKLSFLFILSCCNREVIILLHLTLLLCASCFLVNFTFLSCRGCYSCSLQILSMEMFWFPFIAPFSHGEKVILFHVTLLPRRYCCSCSFYLPVMQKLLFLFISKSLLCRSCYSCSFQHPFMQQLLFSFIAHSSHAEVVILVHFVLSHAEVFILIFLIVRSWITIILLYFTFIECRNCYFCSFHLPLMQK